MNVEVCQRSKKLTGGISCVSFSAPNAPVFRAEECLSEGNIITLVWQPCPGFGIDFYTLEIDDGAGGAYRVGVEVCLFKIQIH